MYGSFSLLKFYMACITIPCLRSLVLQETTTISGAGFGYSTMENRIFPSRLSVACFCAPLQCGVNTGPIKILLLYVLRRLLWPPVLYPSVVCFPKLWLEDHCGGLKVSVPVLHVLP